MRAKGVGGAVCVGLRGAIMVFVTAGGRRRRRRRRNTIRKKILQRKDGTIFNQVNMDGTSICVCVCVCVCVF